MAFVYIDKMQELWPVQDFLETNIIGNSEYFLLKSEVDFYTYINPDSLARLEVQLELYQYFQYEEWSKFRSIFLNMILTAKTQANYYDLEGIALKYKPYAVDYEWLDLYSLILYKSGLENEALEMIVEIREMAWAKGINYKPAIYSLRKE